MLVRCLIIDDEQPAIDVLENYIKRIPHLQLVGATTNPLSGIAMVESCQADLVFLDIQMDEMTGINVLKILDGRVKVIFCTAYSEFAALSYDLNALDYLMKPIPFDRFVQAVSKMRVIDKVTQSNSVSEISNDYIFVKTEQKGKMLKIAFDDIDYIEAMGNYIAFVRGRNRTLVYCSMKDIELYLPVNHFLRIHKSYIVAKRKITVVENNCIHINNQSEKLPLSNTHKAAFMQAIDSKLLR